MAWIPNKILHSYYQNSSEDRLCVEVCLLSCLVPVSMPAEDRMQRMSHVYSRLDDPATRAFEQLLRSREQYVHVVITNDTLKQELNYRILAHTEL